MLRTFLLFLLMVLSNFNISSQCKTCNSFNDALKDPEMVTAIKINSMQHDTVLKKMPDELKLFVNLKTLWLSSHEISKVNEVVCLLEKLESFSLADNKLTGLPDCVYEMKSLKELVLNDNLFSEKEKEAIKRKFALKHPDVKLFF